MRKKSSGKKDSILKLPQDKFYKNVRSAVSLRIYDNWILKVRKISCLLILRVTDILKRTMATSMDSSVEEAINQMEK